jgi:flagellar protein FliO/FliZ
VLSLLIIFCGSAYAQTQASVSETAINKTSEVPETSAAAFTENEMANAKNVPLTGRAKPAVPVEKISSASQLASMLGGLIAIVVLILILSWFVKRFSQGGFLQNPTMKILSTLPLGTRERLLLIDVGGQQLLLGVSATQINTLHVFSEAVHVPQAGAPVVSDFSKKLSSLLQQKATEKSETLA